MAWLPLPKEFDPDFTVPGRKPVGPVLPETDKISVGNAAASWFHLGNPSRPNSAFFDGAKLNLVNGARINHRGVYFDGSNDYATFTNDPTLDAVVSGDFTIHMRLATPNPSQTNTYVINADPNRWNIIYGFNTRTYETFWDTGTFRRTIATLDANDTGYHVISCRRRGNLITVFFDGVPVINEIGTTASLGGTWRIGTSTGLADFWNGTFSDLLFVDGAQSDAFCRDFGRNPYDYLRPVNDPVAFFQVGGDTNINANTEQVSVTTLQAVIESGTNIDANTEQISLQTQIAQLAQDIQAQLEQITLMTQTADLGIEVVANTEQLTLSTLLASVSNNVDITANTEQIVVTEQQAEVVAGTVIDAFTEQIQLATNPAVIESATNIDGVTEQITLNALPGNVVLGTLIQAGTEQIQVTVNQGQVQLDGSISAQTEQIILTELAAQVGIEQNIDANAESITITPQGAEIVFESGVVANTELISLTTNQATIEGVVAVPLGPGLEYTLNQSQIRYTLGINKLHFTLTPED